MSGLFSWGKREPVAPAVDEHAAHPGESGTVPVTDASRVQTDTRRAAAENARRLAKRGPGRPRSDAGDSALTDSEMQTRINAEIAKQLDYLQSPEQWEALLCLPADALATWRDPKRWTFADKERKTLGLCGSAAARTMMITNPRALALLMLSGAMFSTYVTRAVAELRSIAAEKKKESADVDKSKT